jgi:ferric-dicitrate binding protein FerR (iron transport regulator)
VAPTETVGDVTAEVRTEITGTVVSVYKGDGYTCVCVLEGTARVGADEARLEEIPPGMLKIMFSDGSPPIETEIAEQHEADLIEFRERNKDVFSRDE